MAALRHAVLLWISATYCLASVGEHCEDSRVCDDLVCINSTCSYCSVNAECAEVASVNVCNEGVCQHKGLIENINFRDIASYLILIVGGAIAASGGLGGGGIFLPVLVLVSQFTPEAAVPLSNVLILGAAIANYIQMGPKRHPWANRPLIDYSTSLLLLPLSVGGTTVGVILHQVFPQWLTLALLAIVLVVTVFRTSTKALQLWRSESKAAAAAKQPTPASASPAVQSADRPALTRSDGIGPPPSELQEVVSEAASPSIAEDDCSQQRGLLANTPFIADDDAGDRSINADPGDLSQSQASQELAKLLHKESRTPWDITAVLFGILLATLVLYLARGKSSGTSVFGVRGCSPVYWVLMVLYELVLFGLTAAIAYRLTSMHTYKVRLGYEFKPGDVEWTRRRLLTVAGVCLVAGVLASLLGIGGGLVLNPLMLELGVPADVTAATSSFMILFTAFASAFQFAIAGELPYVFGAWFFVLGFVSSLLGQTVVNYLVQKYHKKAIILFCVAGIIAVSTVLLMGVGIMNVVQNVNSGAYMGFNSYC